MTSISDLLKSETASLLESRSEAQILLAHVLGVSKSYLYTRAEELVNQQKKTEFEFLLARRLKGEPIAYLLGHKEFWSLPLKVSNSVLIPRPETELLVELCLKLMEPEVSPIRVLELGTGSGAIALALATEQPNWEILAVDKSEAALEIARANAAALHLNQIQFLKSDWFSDFEVDGDLKPKDFNIIVSNPPYISEDDPHLLQGDLRYEPREALASGDGLDDIRHIIKEAQKYLRHKAWVLLEHGYTQGEAVKELMIREGLMDVQTCNHWS